MSTSADARGLQVLTYAPGPVPGGDDAGASRRGGGFTAGYAAGYSEGLRRAGAAASALAQAEAARATVEREADRRRANRLLSDLATAGEQLRDDSWAAAEALAPLVAALASQVARAVVLEAAPTAGALRARIKRALSHLDSDAAVTVHLNPVDARELAADSGEAARHAAVTASARVVEDPRLGRGDVVVRAGAQTVSDLLQEALDAALAELA